MSLCPDCGQPIKIFKNKRVYNQHGEIEIVCVDCFYRRKHSGQLFKPQKQKDVYTMIDKIASRKTLSLVLKIVLIGIVVWFGPVTFVAMGVENWNYYIGCKEFLFMIIASLLISISLKMLSGKFEFVPPDTKDDKNKPKYTFQPPEYDVCDVCKNRFDLRELKQKEYMDGYILVCRNCENKVQNKGRKK